MRSGKICKCILIDLLRLKKVYPLIGKKTQLNYLITDFENVYVEKYPFTETIHNQLIFEVNEFTEWLEVNRHKITDTKIFTI